MPDSGAPSSQSYLFDAAREVIAAADNTYGPGWRDWRPLGCADGGVRLARALAELENAMDQALNGEARPTRFRRVVERLYG